MSENVEAGVGMERSRKLALTDWTQANNALHQHFVGNKSQLADHLRMSRTTVTAFFKQQPVREAEFRKLCLALRLNWENVSATKTTPLQAEGAAVEPTVSQAGNNLEALIQQVREHCRQKILSQHSRMRLLSGEEIGVDQLYVDVWVLNRSPRTFMVSQSKLLETFDLRNDRLGLGDQIQRNPGFEVANEQPKLVILGKPGSGKTTFLKHLGVDWCKGKFKPDLIAVLIELRRIRDGQWHLLDAIGKELGLNESDQIKDFKEQIEKLRQSISVPLAEKAQKKKRIEALQQQSNTLQQQLNTLQQQLDVLQQQLDVLQQQLDALQQQLDSLPLQFLLTQGNLLILMDGLDELSTSDLRHTVQKEFHAIAEEYPRNRFILTCRTQIMTPIPMGFTSVEVADFSPKQVERFVENWFLVHGKSRPVATQQWETIRSAVDRSSALKELTVTPVLLSLMCVVLQDEGEMPSEKTLLYKKGVKLLLSRWNEEKEIDGWEMGSESYRQLSVEQKERLLIEVAARKFDNPKNFVLFEQDEIADQIVQWLQLPNRKEGVAVLKAIESQHGLLIERADELWSFSHLTFQEYFTVQWLTQLSSEQLAKKILNQQWQNVVRQLLGSQQPADRLVQLIKYAIDQSVAHEPAITQFLTWVFHKANSIQLPYKPVAIRAFYFAFDHSFNYGRTVDRRRALDCVRSLYDAVNCVHNLDLTLNLARTFVHDLALVLTTVRSLDLNRVQAFDFDRMHDLALVYRDLALTLDRNLNFDLTLALARDHTRKQVLKSLSELETQLEQIKIFLPGEPIKLWQWWQTRGNEWTEQLLQVINEHLSMGYAWQFTEPPQQQLKGYYDSNKFLLELLDIKGAVSGSVRAEIEDTLLLPWDELQRRQPNVYR